MVVYPTNVEVVLRSLLSFALTNNNGIKQTNSNILCCATFMPGKIIKLSSHPLSGLFYIFNASGRMLPVPRGKVLDLDFYFY